MAPPIGVGFVGLSTSGWGKVIEPALQRLGDTYRIIAVSTTNEASARASAQRLSEETKHPVKAYYGDTAQIASDPDVDLVLVAVKAPQHRTALLPVIRAKKPFFIEWPAGRNLEETKEFAEAARQNGLRSIVGLQGRQSPILNKAKELIASGKIGNVLSCSVIGATHQEAYMWGKFVKRSIAYTADHSSGGSFLDIALGHHLDTLLYVLGTELTALSATTTIQYPTITLTEDDGTPTGETLTSETPDHIALHGTLANGALLSVACHGGHASTPGRHQLLWVVDGDAGSLRVEGVDPGSFFVQIRAPKVYLDGEEVKVGGEDANDDLLAVLAAQFSEFAKGDGGKYATLDDAVKTRTVLDAIARSGSTHERVDL